jgi:hypothetical protein
MVVEWLILVKIVLFLMGIPGNEKYHGKRGVRFLVSSPG